MPRIRAMFRFLPKKPRFLAGAASCACDGAAS
jgi:hypothetical protein